MILALDSPLQFIKHFHFYKQNLLFTPSGDSETETPRGEVVGPGSHSPLTYEQDSNLNEVFWARRPDSVLVTFM